jgi:hypothetical protein
MSRNVIFVLSQYRLVPNEVQTYQPLNATLERNRYANPLSNNAADLQ